MDAARLILLMLIYRKRAAARAVARAKREHWHDAASALFEATLIETTAAFASAREIYQVNIGGSGLLRHERQRVIGISEERGEFVMLEDGYTHYWPQGSANGALTSWHLRTLADEVDRRNQVWDAHLRKLFGDGWVR